jgi:hypothetical protein
VGGALLQAKQRYFNSIAAGSLSPYDEKAMAEMTLYGLPMLKVRLPNQHAAQAGVRRLAGAAHGLRSFHPARAHPRPAGGTTHTLDTMSFAYVAHATPRGTYYTVQGQNDLQAAGGRPVQPRTALDLTSPRMVLHGVLMLGGSFADTKSFAPVISRVITEQVYADEAVQPLYRAMAWYPSLPVSVNRFLGIDGKVHQRVVMVPGQFRATATTRRTLGAERLYSSLPIEVLEAPFTAGEFVPPRDWRDRAHVLRQSAAVPR